MTKDYQEFLKTKRVGVQISGFEAPESAIHPMLFDWQSEIVRWSIRLGKSAMFEECGSGKTIQLCEWARHVQDHTGGRVLITSPLAVAPQTIKEAAKIGLPVTYVRHQEEVKKYGVYITNYDMLGSFDGGMWDGVVNDESSIIKSYTGATKRMILGMFEQTPYKLACTATPAPNDHLELGNHAQHLNIMQSNEMIQRWFINDTMSAGTYRLKKHAEKDFWKWLTGWGVCISKPSDLGYPDVTDRYSFDMPELIIHNEVVAVDQSRGWDKGMLIVDGTLSATEMWKEKRATLTDRCNRARDIVDESKEQWLIWCDTNDEADYLIKLFPQAVEVRGNHSIRIKEERLNAFAEGNAQILISKPDIAGFGMNFQNCANQIFVGITYSFEKTYQALRRSWRFGQTKDVHAYMISAESEGDIVKALAVKQEAHREMQRAMNEAMKENGLGVTDRRSTHDYETNVKMEIPSWLTSQPEGVLA